MSDLINISATSTVLRISTLALVFLGLIVSLIWPGNIV